MVSRDGRRRLKAETEGSFIDIEKEIQDFNNNSLPYRYSLFDIPNDFEYHIYLKSPEQLDSMYKVNFKGTLDTFLASKENELNKYYSVQIQKDDTTWTLSDFQRHKKIAIELGPFTGSSLINNHFTPMIGLGSYFQKTDKYGKARRRIGFLYELRVLADYNKFEFSNTSLVSSVTFHFDTNLSKELKKDFWTGIHGGIFIAKEGSLKNAGRIGFKYHAGSIAVDFDFIFLRDDNMGLGLTLFYYL